MSGWNHLSRKRVSRWDLLIKELNRRISNRWRTRSDNVFSTKSKGNERKGVGFYRWSARKTKRQFDSRYKPIDERHVSYALNASGQLVRPLYPWRPHTPWTVIQGSSSPSAREFILSPCWLWHRPLSIYSHHLSLNLVSFMSVSHLSTHEHQTVSINLTVTPIGSLLQTATDQMGWRGQLKRIKIGDKAWRA